ncbi:hypothetical protein ACEPAF_2263 [Sanghuangporus sanghuang]
MEQVNKLGDSTEATEQGNKLDSRPFSPFSVTPRRRKPSHRYRGHRAGSFTPDDVNELVEIRARQRTFSGAYTRTALGNLGYAITVLRLFDKRFYHIGLIYTILAALLFILSFFRSRHSRHDFADRYLQNIDSTGERYKVPIIKTLGQTGKRIFGRPFVTAGWIVLGISIVVLAVEITLLVLIIRIDVCRFSFRS